jgi:hypothetical protein
MQIDLFAPEMAWEQIEAPRRIASQKAMAPDVLNIQGK